jgi:hypothetical protein
MPLVTLGYPSRTFVRCSIFNIDDSRLDHGGTYADNRKAQRGLIELIFKELEIKSKYAKGSEEDSRWYWLAGPLIDEVNSDLRIKANKIRSLDTEGKRVHFIYLNETLTSVIDGKIELGAFPSDLFQMLAELTLAGPANAALHVIDKYFPNLGSEYNKLNASFEIGDLFRSLFNRPESISAVRLSTNRDVYWQSVLEYCAAGNIVSMLDEYFFMLKSTEFNSYDALVESLEMVMNLHHSTVDVDLQGTSGKVEKRTMRSHFAVSYGMSSF